MKAGVKLSALGAEVKRAVGNGDVGKRSVGEKAVGNGDVGVTGVGKRQLMLGLMVVVNWAFMKAST